MSDIQEENRISPPYQKLAIELINKTFDIIVKEHKEGQIRYNEYFYALLMAALSVVRTQQKSTTVKLSALDCIEMTNDYIDHIMKDFVKRNLAFKADDLR